MEVASGMRLMVKDLRIQHIIGWEIFSGKIEIVSLVQKEGDACRLKINIGNKKIKHLPNVKDDYFLIKLMNGKNKLEGTASKSKILNAIQ